MTRLLVLNAGSSSLKFALFEVTGAKVEREASGAVESLGGEARLRTQAGDERSDAPLGDADYASATRAIFEWLHGRGSTPDAVGHRVVHGGQRFRAATRVHGETLEALHALTRLAPLHNGPAIRVIEVVTELFDDMPQYAAFDTAFHAQMPAHATHYAIPLEITERHGLYRFGFHGLAHSSMLQTAVQMLERPAETLRLVTLQLGAGASAAAIRDGHSVDTSMGVTPLEGLVMATRSGDVDPALPGLLATLEGLDGSEVERTLNERSGLLGLSGRSGDMREVVVAEQNGDPRARLAIDLYCYRIRKQIGAYIAALGGVDAVVFGGGVGEHQPAIRARACEGLEALGIAIDGQRNQQATGGDAIISTATSAVRVLTAAVDEESVIAREIAGLREG